jgi:hypothetical protein
MTNEMMNLRAMELEVGGLTGAAYGDKDARASCPAQRLSGSNLGNTRRYGRAAHPQAARGKLLSRLPRAAPDGREVLTAVVQEA